jgi:hypothetical protein
MTVFPKPALQRNRVSLDFGAAPPARNLRMALEY